MQVFNKISEWIIEKISESKQIKQKKKAQNLLNEIQEMLQVMEFNGRLYICYDGVPVVRVESLNSDVVEIIQQSRIDLQAWKSQFKH